MEEFKIEKELGKGQFGEVYLVSSLIDQKFYAMKKIPISPTNQLHNKQINIEVNCMKALSPYCQRGLSCLYKYFKHDNHVYIVMSYVIGFELLKYFKTILELNLHDRVKLAMLLYEQMKPVLTLFKSLNITHRDIKPANIMYNPLLNEFTLIDYGSMCVNQCNARLAGTPSYMSPKYYQILADLKQKKQNNTLITMTDYQRSDMYALGICMFQIINNEARPYTLTNEGVFTQHGVKWTVDMSTFPDEKLLINYILSGEVDIIDVDTWYKQIRTHNNEYNEIMDLFSNK